VTIYSQCVMMASDDDIIVCEHSYHAHTTIPTFSYTTTHSIPSYVWTHCQIPFIWKILHVTLTFVVVDIPLTDWILPFVPFTVPTTTHIPFDDFMHFHIHTRFSLPHS